MDTTPVPLASVLANRQSAQRRSRRVLIIDDNVDAADSLAFILRDMGHQVHVAYAGRAALEMTLRTRPEIVLLDIAMPEISGYEVAKQIRQYLGDGVRIFAVTGYGQDEDRLKSVEAGIDQHLIKPLDTTFLDSLFKF
jgi:CheY-like chemotaxis protein